jgi:hypothetical protein
MVRIDAGYQISVHRYRSEKATAPSVEVNFLARFDKLRKFGGFDATSVRQVPRVSPVHLSFFTSWLGIYNLQKPPVDFLPRLREVQCKGSNPVAMRREFGREVSRRPRVKEDSFCLLPAGYAGSLPQVCE